MGKIPDTILRVAVRACMKSQNEALIDMLKLRKTWNTHPEYHRAIDTVIHDIEILEIGVQNRKG